MSSLSRTHTVNAPHHLHVCLSPVIRVSKSESRGKLKFSGIITRLTFIGEAGSKAKVTENATVKVVFVRARRHSIYA